MQYHVRHPMTMVHRVISIIAQRGQEKPFTLKDLPNPGGLDRALIVCKSQLFVIFVFPWV